MVCELRMTNGKTTKVSFSGLFMRFLLFGEKQKIG